MKPVTRATLLRDGSILFDGTVPSLLYYKPDPGNPNRLIPMFPKCKHRTNKSRRSDCGKRLIVLYVCKEYNKSVGCNDCLECKCETK